MNKKVYIVPQMEVLHTEHLMEGNGPVQNSGNGYKYNDDPVDGSDLEGKWADFGEDQSLGKFDELWMD